MILQGISVDIKKDDEIKGDVVKLIDFENFSNNDFLVVNQFTIKGSKGNRRPDLIVFINGLPLAIIELKNPADENADAAPFGRHPRRSYSQCGSLFPIPAPWQAWPQ